MNFEGRTNLVKKYSKDPAKLIAGFGIVRALRGAGLLRQGAIGYVVLVVPEDYRTDEYEAAAFTVLGAKRDDWVEQAVSVRLANPPFKKGSSNGRISIYDTKGLDVLIARDVDEVPRDVLFAATAVLRLDPPTPAHVNAARRVCGRSPLSPGAATIISRKSQGQLLAAVLKPDLAEDRIDQIDEIVRVDPIGPSLFDLPGYDAIKDWAADIAKDVIRWKQKGLAWNFVARGAIISGVPGTGKTHFASALANALGLRLVTATVGGWQATGALDDMLAAMRRTFAEAAEAKGALLFIDEIDSIGMRNARPTGYHGDQYWQTVVNEALFLLNRPGDGVLVVGATNFPDWIDPALKRAGRLESHFVLPLPDKTTRAQILGHHTDGIFPFESLEQIAEDLDGKTGADIEQLVRDALRKARNEGRELCLQDLKAQLPEKLFYTPEQQLRIAVHEAGHALVSLALGHSTGAMIEIKDSFDPSGDGFIGGKVTYDLKEDYFPTETSLRTRIAVSFAGMAAEKAVFGDRSIGGGGAMGTDVELATTLARRMVGSYGLGRIPMFLGTARDLKDKPLSDSLEAEVAQLLEEEWERTLSLVFEQQEQLLDLAKHVVVHRSLKIDRDGTPKAA
ncbi:hypothetical protein FHT77_001765 [Rhizobium sp. BK181]|uniref:AAA family ATPase n=1 Tax=Rhizobium sp. BK181 TaxID=2587072 RepID=UPI001612AF40|nr:AAA family ATPase [Rhizobium sp. BK181]MBB3315900.1 hypothetical protein [Rhizobium sp. BK181]